MNKDGNNFLKIIALTIIAVISSVLTNINPLFTVMFLWVGASFVAISYASDNNANIVLAIMIYTFVQFIFLGSMNYAIISSAVMIVPVVILGKAMKKKQWDEAIYLICTVIMAIMVIAVFKMLLANGEFIKNIKSAVDEAVKNLNTANSMYKFPTKIDAETMIKTMKEIFPATVIIISLLYVTFSKYMAMSIIKKQFPEKQLELAPFNRFVVPSKLGALFVIFYIIANIMVYSGNITRQYYTIIMNNVLYVMAYMLMMDGLAVIMYAMRNTKSRFAKNLVVVILIFLFFIVNLPLVILGVLDMAFDFRKLGFRRKI